MKVDVFNMDYFKGEAQDERLKSINGEKTLKHESLTLKLFTILHKNRFWQSVHDNNNSQTITTRCFERISSVGVVSLLLLGDELLARISFS